MHHSGAYGCWWTVIAVIIGTVGIVIFVFYPYFDVEYRDFVVWVV